MLDSLVCVFNSLISVEIKKGQVIFEMGDLKLASFCVQHAAYMNEGLKDNVSADEMTKHRALSSRKHEVVGRSGANSSVSTSSSMFMNQSVTQRAVVFSFLKNYAKAISVLENELRFRQTPDIYNLLGRVYMKSKNWIEAVRIFDRSIQSNVNFTKKIYFFFIKMLKNIFFVHILSPRINSRTKVLATFRNLIPISDNLMKLSWSKRIF